MIAPKVMLEYCFKCNDTGYAEDSVLGRTRCPVCPRGQLNGSTHVGTDHTPTAEAGSQEDELCGWEPVDLAAALDRDGPPPPELLERSDGVCLLYPGRCHAFIGEPEGMKSWGWQLAAAHLLADSRPVLVIDFENDEDAVVERLRALGTTPDDVLAGLTYVRPQGPWDDRASFTLARLRAGRRFALAVIDGVTDGMAALGLDADKNRDAATFDRRLVKPFARAGAAVVLTDHVVKDREGRGRYAIGAQHKLAAIDGATFVFEVVAPFGREKEGVARIELTKDKPGWLRRNASGKTIATLRLSSYPDGGVTGRFEPPAAGADKPGFVPTALMEKVSRYVELHPGLSKNAIFGAVNGKKEYAFLAVELLVSEGYLRTEPGPRGATFHHSERPYRSADRTPDGATDDPPN